MTKINLDKLMNDLEWSWSAQRGEIIDCENSWWAQDIEMEFYEEQCLNMGYSEDQIETVLEHMGY